MSKFFVKGIGEIELSQHHFLASGGEGDIYTRGDVAYKICPNHMIPESKIRELQAIKHDRIIIPTNVVFKKNKPVGYTLPFVKNASPLSLIFTKTFKTKNNISNQAVLELVKSLQKMITFIHSKKIIVVDMNEYNFLVDDTFKKLFAIDTNSYKTPTHNATAIMASIHDPLSPPFTELSDWYSWGILVCQMIMGVHPFKGNHPDFDSVAKPDRLLARMKQNVSIFNPKTKIPKVCPPLSNIPLALQDWMKAVFEKGKRMPPPVDFTTTIVRVKPKVVVGNVLTIKDLGAAPLPFTVNSPKWDIQFTFTYNEGILSGVNELMLPCKDIPIDINNIFVSNGTLYVVCNTQVLELIFHEFSRNNISYSFNHVANVLDAPNATFVGDGCVLQKIFDSCYLYRFDKTGESTQTAINECKGQIVSAKYERNILVIVTFYKQNYIRWTFRFKQEKYTISKHSSTTILDSNFTVLENGICILLNEEEKLEITHGSTPNVKIVDDKAISADMLLTNDGQRLLVTQGDKLYHISL